MMEMKEIMISSKCVSHTESKKYVHHVCVVRHDRVKTRQSAIFNTNYGNRAVIVFKYLACSISCESQQLLQLQPLSMLIHLSGPKTHAPSSLK